MDLVNDIYQHPLYQEQFQALQRAEQDRIFCRHTMEHFLDVARLMYIRTLEESLDLSKTLLYATALLHDIGRYEQIAAGTPHHLAGARIAEKILRDCNCPGEERERICSAIMAHRKIVESDDPLIRLLYQADKRSRLCFLCTASEACNWSEEKKNLHIDD